MNSVLCTLFEGHFHYGVAALANSLYKEGFRGSLFAGYRGELPFWASKAEMDGNLKWPGATTFNAAHEFQIHFLPLSTDYHFANYKSHFVLQVWDKYVNQAESPGIFYFDPDIVIKCNWEFYERWITYGVAMVHEIVWNDMPYNHPKRHQWISIAKSLNFSIHNRMSSYVNAGFFGVSKDRLGFLRMWKQLIEYSLITFSLDKTTFSQDENDFNMFKGADQDLFNLTAMCTEEEISEFGPEGMDFIGGGWLMSHATGSPKPWKTNFISEWLKGKSPSISTKEYWKNANGIINCYPGSFIKTKYFFQKLSSALSRFYRRAEN